jgi:DNA-binding GntR family transcriptional regulator
MSTPIEPSPVGEAPDLAPQVERVAAPLRTQVSDILRREIVEMRLHPGQRLVERELIERIGVSRTTMVTTIPQKGAIVAIPSPKEAAEVYEVRALLEGLAAREFVDNATELHLGALQQAMGQVARAGKKNDADGVLRAKNRFYDVLFDGADNATIRSILGGLQARVAVLRATSLTAPDRPRESVTEIQAIVDAIERRDADAAAEAASFHVRRAAETAFRQIGIAPEDGGAE